MFFFPAHNFLIPQHEASFGLLLLVRALFVQHVFGKPSIAACVHSPSLHPSRPHHHLSCNSWCTAVFCCCCYCWVTVKSCCCVKSPSFLVTEEVSFGDIALIWNLVSCRFWVFPFEQEEVFWGCCGGSLIAVVGRQKQFFSFLFSCRRQVFIFSLHVFFDYWTDPTTDSWILSKENEEQRL